MKNIISCFNICIIIQEKEKIYAFKHTFSFKKFTKFYTFINAFSFIKFTNFHVFINTFLKKIDKKIKKNKIKKTKRISCTQTSILIQKKFIKFHFHAFINALFKKNKTIKFYVFKHAFSFKPKVQIQSKI